MKNLQKDTSLKSFLSQEQTEELLDCAANVLAKKIKDHLSKDQWVIKSIVPFWVIESGNPRAWEDLKENFAGSTSSQTLDALLVLLLRTKGDTDVQPMKPLPDLLNMQRLAHQFHALKDARQEFRPPVVAAIQYFHTLRVP